MLLKNGRVGDEDYQNVDEDGDDGDDDTDAPDDCRFVLVCSFLPHVLLTLTDCIEYFLNDVHRFQSYAHHCDKLAPIQRTELS